MQPLAEGTRQVYLFGAYKFDAVTGVLRKSGVRLTLRPQGAELLALLISQAGQTVTRERIRQSLWGGDITVDFEVGINRCVRELRAVLSDDAEKPRFIRTLARHGYRFIKPVSRSEDEAPPLQPKAAIESMAVETLSLAVLPFVNLSGEAGDEYFSDGLTEETINVLAQIRNLNVIARTSAFAFKGKNEDVRSIARSLGVNHIVEGSTRRAGTTTRVTVQLIRASDGVHIFSKRYDHELTDVFGAQDQIAKDIAAQLHVHLHLRHTYVPVFAAHEAYLEGRYHYLRFSPQGFMKALCCFERAAHLDPNYSRPVAGIADYWRSVASEYVGRPVDLLPRALLAASRAVALDDQDAEAQAALATSLAMLEYSWPTASKHFERSRELSKGPGVRINYAYWYLLPQARLEDALRESEQVTKSDPLLLLGYCLKTSVLLSMRDYDAAAIPCLRALEIEPDFAYALRLLAMARARQGRFADALELAHRVLKLRGNDAVGLDALGIVSALSGDRETAYSTIGSIMQSPSGPNGPSRFASIYAILGDTDKALKSLEDGVAIRDPRVLWMRNASWFDSLRSSPQYAALLKAMKLA